MGANRQLFTLGLQILVDGVGVTKHGEFNWVELQTRDAEQAVQFYASVIGWSFKAEDMPSGGTYWIGFASDKPVCGILTSSEDRDGGCDRWVTYVHIDDIDSALENVDNLGGKVLRRPWDVSGVGRIVMIRDPGGAEVGWVTPV